MEAVIAFANAEVARLEAKAEAMIEKDGPEAEGLEVSDHSAVLGCLCLVGEMCVEVCPVMRGGKDRTGNSV
eukprot:3931997-Rhodomonas_salina.3